MPDRLSLEMTPKERLAPVAAILARAVRRYVRNSATRRGSCPRHSGRIAAAGAD